MLFRLVCKSTLCIGLLFLVSNKENFFDRIILDFFKVNYHAVGMFQLQYTCLCKFLYWFLQQIQSWQFYHRKMSWLLCDTQDRHWKFLDVWTLQYMGKTFKGSVPINKTMLPFQCDHLCYEESKMNAEYQWRNQVLYAPRQPQTQPNNYLRYMNKQFVQCINKIIWFVWYKLKIRKDKKYTRNTKIKCSQLKQFSIKDCWKFSKLLTAISLHREQNWRSNEKNLHWWISILYYQK